MGSHAPRSPERRSDSGYWVEAPRTTDAIGFVLRDAYVGDHGLPDEMQDLLSQLCEMRSETGGRDSHG
ncbi:MULTISPECIES: hypothetical protein [unclassified Sphingomonas]|uniref:hypothetical protein n=1 Tax=unclassified Sphingomonas TaxID=196159 RepID=UPI0021508795|nr:MULTISPECIES: hypothetical protein [unclassified Sphingomonas]MCR5871746.1 hypothetical protein [Sphingomonas sp. J344]UUX99967.1 hypothetical protein LRS08_02130 [Sphingomonas sp. J315]